APVARARGCAHRHRLRPLAGAAGRDHAADHAGVPRVVIADTRESTMNESARNARRRGAAADTARGPPGDALARAGDGACVVGTDGRILLWNHSAETMLGYAAREVLGRCCWDVFAAHDDNGNPCCYRGCQVMSLVTMGAPIQSFDVKTRTKTGQ